MAPAGPALPDPVVHLAPTALYRRLADGAAPVLWDLRGAGARPRLAAAVPFPGPGAVPPAGTVLIDDDGTAATAAVRRLHAAGHRGVRALYGGMRLYCFALDPVVVGERFLAPAPAGG